VTILLNRGNTTCRVDGSRQGKTPPAICWCFYAFVFFACGRINYQVEQVDGGVPLDDAATWPTQSFAPPTRIDSLSLANTTDDDPTMTSDLLELYFNSNRPGGLGLADIWVTTRNTPQDDWGIPSPVVQLNSSERDSDPEVSADGLTMILASQRPGTIGAMTSWCQHVHLDQMSGRFPSS
jgi:hypothetical protein